MPAVIPDFDTLEPATEVKNYDVRSGNSPSESYTPNSNSAKWTVKVPWSKRRLYAAYFLGCAALTEDGLTRSLPQQYPGYPGWFVTQINSIKGFKILGTETFEETPETLKVAEYDEAILEMTVEQVRYQVVADDDIETDEEYNRYTSRGDIRPSAEYLTLPGSMLKYTTEDESSSPHGEPIPYSVGRVLPLEEFEIIWHRVPYEAFEPGSPLFNRVYGDPDDTESIPYLGCVNLATFDGRGPGKVLFTNVRPTLNKSPIGDVLEWELAWVFTYDPRGWNNKLRVKLDGGNSATWHHVSTSGAYEADGEVSDGDSIYNERELFDLWNVLEIEEEEEEP